MEARSALSLSSFCALAMLAAAIMSLSATDAPARTVPVLILEEEAPEACQCNATVVPSYVSGQMAFCGPTGAEQPCFSAVIEGTPQLEDTKGVCESPGNPPLVPACKKLECVFAERKIRVQAANCAGISGCGPAPYRLRNVAGAPVGQKFSAEGSEAVTVSLEVLACGDNKEYVISVIDGSTPTANVVLEYKVTAKCAQCSRLGN